VKPIRFLAALLVLASFTLPWVYLTPGALGQMGVSADSKTGDVSFISLFQDTYSQGFLSQLAGGIGKGNYHDLIYALGVLFIGLGAFIGLGSRSGHFVGILGLVLVSYLFIRIGGWAFVTHLWGGSGASADVGMDVGYIVTWLGFLVGSLSR